MRNRRDNQGFALAVVLVLVGVSAVVGLSLLSGTCVSLVSSEDALKSMCAGALAESGLKHAAYLLCADVRALEGNPGGAVLGPYQLEAGSPGDYRFSAVRSAPASEEFLVRGWGRSAKLEASRAIRVRRTPAKEYTIAHSLVLTNEAVWLPTGMRVGGDVHVNGALYSSAEIDGNVTATGQISDLAGAITGAKNSDSEHVRLPDIQMGYYRQYELAGADCRAAVLETNVFAKDDLLASSGSITPSNPAGVVWLKPVSGDTVTLSKHLSFRGTILVDGNLRLGGKDIELEATGGFPAVVVTGEVQVTDAAQAVIRGVVASAGGIRATEYARRTDVSIEGAVVGGGFGPNWDLDGKFTVTYQGDRCKLLNLGGRNGVATVRVLDVVDGAK